MQIVSYTQLYEFTLPEEYHYEESNDTANVYKPVNGVGALTISCYGIPLNYDFILNDELKKIGASIDSTLNTNRLDVHNDGLICYSDFISKNNYWKIWVLFLNNYALFASYNCDELLKNEELENIDGIMRTMRIRA